MTHITCSIHEIFLNASYLILMTDMLSLSIRCLFFGDVSSKRNPTTYLNCIFALYDDYRKEYCNSDDSSNIGLPLVVNTPGWVKGMVFSLV